MYGYKEHSEVHRVELISSNSAPSKHSIEPIYFYKTIKADILNKRLGRYTFLKSSLKIKLSLE